ncbi:MAG: hypothetical protein FRX49_04058 [Trebouxia sp. A1-2]|nr:MAG: hypothetical protein FRX49_04058 [Trebouxia sp. A1-2]
MVNPGPISEEGTSSSNCPELETLLAVVIIGFGVVAAAPLASGTLQMSEARRCFITCLTSIFFSNLYELKRSTHSAMPSNGEATPAKAPESEVLSESASCNDAQYPMQGPGVHEAAGIARGGGGGLPRNGVQVCVAEGSETIEVTWAVAGACAGNVHSIGVYIHTDVHILSQLQALKQITSD